jgi:hypothetical protein
LILDGVIGGSSSSRSEGRHAGHGAPRRQAAGPDDADFANLSYRNVDARQLNAAAPAGGAFAT